jgi:hypothetical protein
MVVLIVVIGGLYAALTVTLLTLAWMRWTAGRPAEALVTGLWALLVLRISLRWFDLNGIGLGIVGRVVTNEGLIAAQLAVLLVSTTYATLVEFDQRKRNRC